MTSPVYPWSAVVGQERLKLALLLCAIDPGIGGVLVRGPRGVAKTTLARALAAFVPGRFVELPLGATEERVTGTLDLARALRDQAVAFAPGLLASAHDGVLYVDEVNLLADPLVDVLLDAAASGVNVVERDGVSHAHPARFVLIGTMNPEEGELRPQLTDRFGLAVAAEAEISPDERREIVVRRLAFEADPPAFVARHAAAQAALADRCRLARARLTAIPLDDAALADVGSRCLAAGVEGVRADLAMLRAARAHAAWEGRDAIAADDVAAVAELALAHRRPDGAPPDGGAPTDGSSRGGARSRESTPSGGGTSAADGDRGTGAVHAVAADAPILSPLLIGGTRRPPPRLTCTRAVGRQPSRRIDWFATLARAPRPAVADLRHRRAHATRRCQMVLLDCSGSMLRAGALAAAKGVVRGMMLAATRRRIDLVLLTFGGARVRVERKAHGRRAAVERAIARIGAGGGTPLGAALRRATTLAQQIGAASGGVHLVVLTDGRVRDTAAMTPAPAAWTPLLVDCERTRHRLGRARDVARGIGADYVHVDAVGGGRATRPAS